MYSVGDKCGAVRSRSTPHDVVSFVVVIVSDERGKCAAVDQFRDVAVATGLPRLRLVAGERVRGHRDDRHPGELGDRADAARRLVAVNDRELNIHQDQIGILGLRHRHPFGSVHRLDQFVIEAGQQVADDLPVVLRVLSFRIQHR